MGLLTCSVHSCEVGGALFLPPVVLRGNLHCWSGSYIVGPQGPCLAYDLDVYGLLFAGDVRRMSGSFVSIWGYPLILLLPRARGG